MTIAKLSATLALSAGLFIATHLGAVESNDKIESLPPAINTVCPMDGKPIDMTRCSVMKMTMGEGAEAKPYCMTLCSETCMKEFKKDPAAALKPVFGKGAPGAKTQYK